MVEIPYVFWGTKQRRHFRLARAELSGCGCLANRLAAMLFLGHEFVMAGLDPAIYLLRKNLPKSDGCADQVRA
jgi:hypothetical protein